MQLAAWLMSDQVGPYSRCLTPMLSSNSVVIIICCTTPSSFRHPVIHISGPTKFNRPHTEWQTPQWLLSTAHSADIGKTYMVVLYAAVQQMLMPRVVTVQSFLWWAVLIIFYQLATDDGKFSDLHICWPLALSVKYCPKYFSLYLGNIR